MAFGKPTSKADAPIAATSTPSAPASTSAPKIILPSSPKLRLSFTTNADQDPANPNNDPFLSASKPLRILGYGKPKTRKTWWGGTAAKSLRTTILDGDTNTGILNQLPPDNLANVQVIPMTQIGHPTIFPQFLACLSGRSYGRCFAFPLDGTIPIRSNAFNKPALIKAEKEYLLVNLDALTAGDLLIVDSYTTLIHGISHIYNRDRDIDPMKGEILDENDPNKYRYFRYHEAVVKELLGILRELPCNIYITAHAQHYETEFMVGKSKQKFGNIQIVSYSGTDGARAPALVSDVLYFEPSAGKNTKSIIHATSEDYRIGGCTHIPPASYEFPDWDFNSFLKLAKLTYPTPEQCNERFGPWITQLSGEEILAAFS